MLVFFTKLSLVEFLIRILVLLFFFSIIGCFLCFWVVYIFETVLLMLLVLKDSFVAPCFSCNVLMIFHVIYNIALNADNLISAPSVVVILICRKNFKQVPNLTLIFWHHGVEYEFVKKLNLGYAGNNCLWKRYAVAIVIKMDRSGLDEKSSFKKLRLYFSFKIIVVTLPLLLKVPITELEPLFHEISFLWGCTVSVEITIWFEILLVCLWKYSQFQIGCAG